MLKLKGLSARRGATDVLHDINLSVPQGSTLAVVGESGAGKSTLIAAVLGLIRPWRGAATWQGKPVSAYRPTLVMQEPRAAFNPVWPLYRAVAEPVRGQLPRDRLERLCAGLELSSKLLERRPNDVSIGQAQRVGILRALISAPPLVFMDEPLSALDAVTQKRTARLIADLQAEENFTILVVTHDLGYAVAYADEIAVLRLGRIEEVAAPQEFTTSPKSPYCRSLRDAAVALGGLEVGL